ncbi:EscU/YscU/HrcU family type III secretion system export apparatus switch protein [Neobacillus sp. OS1-2]|uniref:EscU/YscU/HrcU family type III secretion system export apparatus switch protein n=1 Tax=Neobacillus sp. OS1-2 TaxID=3070680 RepID=UPI0027E17685|nr:EscU/YscU/HrcU family type III secretion system export apparatus switch protein [Neobacillus sp. OS1-2]WML39989.1 EscU/YscU/HrcU family type III secretion system export apparatus switch protein [Neobacillus sp. OS1-2]
MSKKTKRMQAVALTYNAVQQAAPKVVAKGAGHVANSIIEKAKEHQVPIQEDPSLVELLSQLQLNETIPEELYNAVAEVFAFIYQVDRHHANQKT